MHLIIGKFTIRDRGLMLKRLFNTAVFICLGGQCLLAQSTGSIQGRVTDPTGAAVLGAVVTVETPDGNRHVTATDGDGAFQISSLPVGNCNVKISANGLSDWSAANVPVLVDAESNPVIAVLQVAPVVTTVTVSLPPEEVATEQFHEELNQRALGVIPNYYVTYNKDAAPLSAEQKLHLGVRMLIDPTTFAAVGLTAGIQQAKNSYHQFGQGAEGYAKRFGAAYGVSVNVIMITAVAANAIFHQDPRYFYSGEGTKTQRAWYAVKSAFLARGDNGKWQPPYAALTGMIASAEISQIYLPGSRTQYTLLGRSLLFRFGGATGMNLAEEFLMKKVTSHRPAVEPKNEAVLREGTPVPLIAVDGLNAEGATTGKTVSFVLSQDLEVNGKVVAKAGDVASGQVGQISSGNASDEGANVTLEQVRLRAGDVDVPLRSSQLRGVVSPMQYKVLTDSGKIAVTLFVARNVPLRQHD